MKKAILAFTTAALLFGCEPVTETKTKTVTNEVNPVAVGDELAGGFVVTDVDATTGYLATRDLDEDPATTDDVQGLVYGRWTKDITLTADTEWTLNGPVFIGNDNSGNATLTIEAGTVIKGSSSSTAPGMLVITRGSKIMAEGTSVAPIVFTSERSAGSRAAGDWGGVIINGNAVINDGDASGVAEGEGNTGKYGGSNNADNSGVLKYVRIEFAGKLFTADNELNGLALQGVGSGTTLDYIQVHKNADDGVEFFGGKADISHFLVTGAEDDSLDWTSGWTGKAQYGILVQYGVADVGIEADNKEGAVDALPRSNPTLANLTMIGRGASGKVGALFRRGTSATMLNSLVANFKNSLDATHSSGDANTLVFKGVFTTENLDGAVAAYVSGENNNLKGADLASANLPAELTDATFGNETTYKASAAPAGYTASADAAAAAFLGAIDPAGSDWTSGWTTSAQN